MTSLMDSPEVPSTITNKQLKFCAGYEPIRDDHTSSTWRMKPRKIFQWKGQAHLCIEKADKADPIIPQQIAKLAIKAQKFT